MGDCLIRLLMASKLLPNNNQNDATKESKDQAEWQTILNQIFSSDTTVREVIEAAPVALSLLEQSQDKVCLWDCTLHPPKDITDWPLHSFSEVKGMKSKTLFDAGWFPSATLRLSLQSDGIPNTASSSLQYDDHQYNLPTFDSSSTAAAGKTCSDPIRTVQLVDSNSKDGKPLPSQVLHSVTQRFEGEEANATTTETEALQQRRQHQKERQQKEQDRFRKLEARIRRLDEKKNKSNKTSNQVKRMLIKSRATGAASLKAQDRVYFQIVVDHDTSADDAGSGGGEEEEEEEEENTEEFRYFSIQDTVSRVLGQFTNSKRKSNNNNLQSELLVPKKLAKAETGVYRRLPGIMRVYEAIEQKHLDPEFNSIVIRWYDPSSEAPTTSVLDDSKEDIEMTENVMTGQDQPQDMEVDPPVIPTALSEEQPEPRSTSATDESIIVDDDLASRIRTMDEEEQKKSKKKKTKSSTSAKVRQMLIKSKAKGDAKRLKMEDRFFFELILVSSSKDCCETSFAYLGKNDPIGRILRDCVKASLSNSSKAKEDCDYLVVQPVAEDNKNEQEVSSQFQFQRLDNPSMSFAEAESAKLIQPFDRLVVRFHQ